MPGRSLLAAALCACTFAVAPTITQAAEGGPKCPWQQEATVQLGGKSLQIPPSVFESKGPPPEIDGYELMPNVGGLVLHIKGPRGEIWEAALTRIAEKRCTAFYVGKPVMVVEPQPPQLGRSKSSVAVR